MGVCRVSSVVFSLGCGVILKAEPSEGSTVLSIHLIQEEPSALGCLFKGFMEEVELRESIPSLEEAWWPLENSTLDSFPPLLRG